MTQIVGFVQGVFLSRTHVHQGTALAVVAPDVNLARFVFVLQHHRQRLLVAIVDAFVVFLVKGTD